jgi:diphthamide synthase (EF-2-diphthine--ammonia ligase)
MKAEQQTYVCLKAVKNLNYSANQHFENSEACERIARKNFDIQQQEQERLRIEKAGEDGTFNATK